MSILPILRMGHPVLRRVAQPYLKEEITSQKTQELVKNMIATMKKADGIGLAAPQVGIPKQLVVIHVPKFAKEVDEFPLTVAFNPKIEFLLRHEKIQMVESCLSVPGLTGKVERFNNLLMTYIDEHGKERKLGATGLIAGIIQHETDHLFGRLFVDNIKLKQDLAFEKEWEEYRTEQSPMLGHIRFYD